MGVSGLACLAVRNAGTRAVLNDESTSDDDRREPSDSDLSVEELALLKWLEAEAADDDQAGE